MIKAVIMLNNGPLIFIPSLYKLDAFNRRMYVCNLKNLRAVHKLCCLKGGGEGVKHFQFYLVKKTTKRGRGSKSKILRQYSLRTALKSLP